MKLAALLPLIAIAFSLASCKMDGVVKATDAPLTIPTYKIGAPSPFPDWRHKIYPYTLLETITDSLGAQKYNAVTLENEFVKILVLPDIGGRLHNAYDKTNGYCYLYDQKTIKPAKVGLTGAWISGGIEYNFPVGHRASGFRPVDYVVERNSDGSVAAWTGEYEQLKGMRWSVAHILRPRRNVLETKVRLYNSTPFTHAFQFWATAAVHITPEYQAMYPMDIWTGHGKQEFGHYPMHKGRDISFWKNTEDPSSFFAWDCERDFFGGYSHDLDAGTAIFADHNIVPGKKLWTWGTGGIGQMWCKILTDSGGHYFEPQAGGFSDNQPDQHWIRPFETKEFSIYWFPVRGIGAFKAANLEGAVNLEERGNDIFLGAYATSNRKGATVRLTRGDALLWEKKVDLGPARPFTVTVPRPEGCSLPELRLAVLAGKKELVAYQPEKPAARELPQPVFHSQAVPKDVTTIDSLYEAGSYHNRFDNVDRALDFFNEALRRDPQDSRRNAEKALILLKRGQADSAQLLLQLAAGKDPENGMYQYYQAEAELQLQDTSAAYKHFFRATYDQAWKAAAYYQLGLLDLAASRAPEAVEKAEQSLLCDGQNSQAWALKTAALRRCGRKTTASEAVGAGLALDPMNFWLVYEASLLGIKGPDAKKLLRNDPQNYISLALDYVRINELKRAVTILRTCTAAEAPLYPMVGYYQGYCLARMGQNAEAQSAFAAAGRDHVPTCFPYRLESIPVLRAALKANPQDASAANYLGLLLYAKKRPVEARPLWEQSAAQRPQGDVLRNLGWTLWKDHPDQLEKAREAYVKAVDLSKNPQYLYELAQITLKTGNSTRTVLDLLNKFPNLLPLHDDLLSLYCSCLLFENQFQLALNILNQHQFHAWEGGDYPHVLYRTALLGLAEKALQAKEYDRAGRCLDSALEWPFHLQVSYDGDKFEQKVYYERGRLLQAMGQTAEAKQAWEQAAVPPKRLVMTTVYSAMALKELGRTAEAKKHLESVIAGIALIAKRRGGEVWAPQYAVLAEAYRQLGNMAQYQANSKQGLDMDLLSPLQAYSRRYFEQE